MSTLPQGTITPEYRTQPIAGYKDPRRAPLAWRWTAWILAPFIWGVPALILCGIVAGVTGLAFIPNGWIVAPFLTLMLLNLVSRAQAVRRERNGWIILNYVESAVRLNLPLPPYLRAAERSERGRIRRQLRLVCEHLEGGAATSLALESAIDIPEAEVETLAAHESLGQLQPGLARLKERQRQVQNDREERPDSGIYRFYPQFMFTFVLVVLLGMMIFILPKFREIFKDFKTTLPPMAKAVFGVSSFVSEQPLLFIPLALLCLVALFVPMSVFLQRLFISSWPEPRWNALLGWVKWRVPFFRGMERDAGMAAACELWEQAVGAGVPLGTAVQRAAQLPVNSQFRRALMTFAARLNAGQTPSAAARGARMPELLVGMLAPLSTGVGVSAAAMFGFLARYYRQKFSRAVVMLQAAAGPISVLIVGALVLIILSAVISTMTVLLQSVMEAPRGVL